MGQAVADDARKVLKQTLEDYHKILDNKDLHEIAMSEQLIAQEAQNAIDLLIELTARE